MSEQTFAECPKCHMQVSTKALDVHNQLNHPKRQVSEAVGKVPSKTKPKTKVETTTDVKADTPEKPKKKRTLPPGVHFHKGRRGMCNCGNPPQK